MPFQISKNFDFLLCQKILDTVFQSKRIIHIFMHKIFLNSKKQKILVMLNHSGMQIEKNHICIWPLMLENSVNYSFIFFILTLIIYTYICMISDIFKVETVGVGSSYEENVRFVQVF